MARRKQKRRYFIEERRATYLAMLRRTGNHRAAAETAGISASAARRYRKRTPDYAARCLEAEREAEAVLAGAESPFDGARDGAFESIRRGADGRLKIQAQGKRRWSVAAEDVFFAVLRESGNIAASARAAGVSRESVWKRRRRWPAFARRFEETMDEAEVVLEFRVACVGTNWADEVEDRLGEEDPPAGGEGAPPPSSGRSPSPGNPGEDQIGFDPEFALRFLKWREEKRHKRAGTMAALPSAEAARERILRKVMAVKRHQELMAKRASEGGPGAG